MQRTIVGRQFEVERVQEFTQCLRRSPAALVITGEPGIGKTAVFSLATDMLAAAGYRVVALADLQALLAWRAGAASLSDLGRHVGETLAWASREAPVVIAVDDWDTAPEPARSVLAYVAARLRGRTGVLITCGGTGALPLRHDDLGDGAFWQLALGALSPAVTRALVRDRLGGPLGATVCGRIAAVAQGNPRIALELAGAAAATPPAWAWACLPVPAALRERACLAIAGRAPDGRDALLALALLERADASVLAALAGDASVRAVLADGLARTDPDGGVTLADPLLAAALYDELDPAVRQARHAQAARSVADPDQRARHLALAGEGPDSEVADALEAAAMRAAARGEPRLAGELARESAARTPAALAAAVERRTLQCARALALAGDVAAAHAAVADVSGVAAATLAVQLQAPASQARLQAELPGAGGVERVLALDALAWRQGLRDGDVAGGLAAASLAAAAAERLDDAPARTRALTTLAALAALGADPAADARLSRAAAAGADALLAPCGRPVTWRALRRLWRGELDGARALLEGQLDDALRIGAVADASLLATGLAQADLAAGRLAGAQARLDQAAAILAEAGRPPGAWQLAVQAAVAGAVEAPELATALTAEAAARAADEPDWLAATLAGATLARLDLINGRPAVARRRLDALAAKLARRGLRDPGVFRLAPDRIEALLGCGEPARALRCLRGLARAAETLAHPWAHAAVIHGQARVLVARGDVDAGLLAHQRAVEAFGAIGHELDAARAAMDLATALLLARRKRQAADAFTVAAERFAATGATAWAARAAHAAQAANPRPDAHAVLTPSEERIAMLVLNGCSNKEIALRLRTTLTAVEAHLSRMYRKLGVRSRGQLVALISNIQSREVAA